MLFGTQQKLAGHGKAWDMSKEGHLPTAVGNGNAYTSHG